MCEILQKVKERRQSAPGYLVHSERRIYPQEPTEEELRDPRDAIMGIACKTGDTFVGITPYVGLKNEVIIGAFDEASLMPAGFWDAIANLKKGGSVKTKFIGMGNPKDHYDALGKICEPRDGWESLEESLHSRSWKTRAGGIAVAAFRFGYTKRNRRKWKTMPRTEQVPVSHPYGAGICLVDRHQLPLFRPVTRISTESHCGPAYPSHLLRGPRDENPVLPQGCHPLCALGSTLPS